LLRSSQSRARQLHERVRSDPRVVVLDRVNARSLSPVEVPEPCGLATLDLSFISALKVLPAVRSIVEPGADVVVLVKPQFEVGRRDVRRGGLVTDPEKHRAAVLAVARGAQELGYASLGACPSPITGSEGNREFFLHLRSGGAPIGDARLTAMVEKAVKT
jgi:23S rRNA (cytidine1920-2'-O)/16S rRNA (cytidine1409-2'-O)-methyltransferase